MPFSLRPFRNQAPVPRRFQIQDIFYTVERSRRRTIALQVRDSGEVLVRAPRWALASSVHGFVRQKLRWLRKALERVEQQARTRLSGLPGERIFVWGEPLLLAVAASEGRELSWQVDGERLVVALPDGRPDPALIRQTIRRAYRQAVQARVAETLPPVAARLGVAVKEVTVGFAKARWGSCNARGRLRFNGRLAMMPPAMLEYVIVHEAAHLREMNHSKRFWSLVEGLLPDYKTRQRWMREQAPRFDVG
jgi:predicted metal-dependent hydrolase